MAGIIKISELNTFPSLVTTDDFFPIDKSSSLLTYRISVGQIQSLFSTGSFTGSLKGSLLGTASWANNSISSSYALTASYSPIALSSSYALTASYVSGSGGSVTGTGTAQYFTKWSNTNVLTNADMYFDNANNTHVSTRNLVVFRSAAYLLATGSGQTSVGATSTYNSALALTSATTASDAFVIACTAEGEYGDTAWGRGGIDFNVYTSSNNFTYGSRTYAADALQGGIARLLRIRSNGWYVWPLTSVQGVSRDGTFNIGVDSGTENHDTRLKIQVFSGSSANPTVDHLRKAIEVSYGSGSSYPVTFCVSSSGQVIAAGYTGSNFNQVAFYGTASYAMNVPGNLSNIRVPVFVTTSSNVSLESTTNFNLILSLSLPSGYTTWDEFSIRANLCVDNTGNGKITGSLCYGDGTLFSLISGSGNSGQVFSYDNSDDSVTPIWEYFGLVTGSKKTDNPLVLSASFNYTSATISSRYIYARAYAKN